MSEELWMETEKLSTRIRSLVASIDLPRRFSDTWRREGVERMTRHMEEYLPVAALHY